MATVTVEVDDLAALLQAALRAKSSELSEGSRLAKLLGPYGDRTYGDSLHTEFGRASRRALAMQKVSESVEAAMKEQGVEPW